MEQFYGDLVEEIASLMPVSRKSAGFRDEAAVEPGENWPTAMANALGECQTFVYIHSPRYFASDYCGKEWAVFRGRVRHYVEVNNLPKTDPRLMLPVLWLRPGDVAMLPKAVEEVQYTHKDFGQVYSQEGLQHLIKHLSKYEAEYHDFVEASRTSCSRWARLGRWLRIRPSPGSAM